MPDERRRLPVRFGRNTASTYLLTAVTVVTGIVVTPIVVRHLGKEAYGVWVVASSMILYLELFEFGFGKTTVAYVARLHGAGDDDGVRSTIVTSMLVLAVPGALALVVAIVFALVFPGVFHVGALTGEMRVVMLLSGLALALSIPGDTAGGTLMALQRYDLLNGTLAVTTVAQAVATVAVLWSGGGLVGLALVTASASVAGQVMRYVMVCRLVPGLRLSRRWARRDLVRPLASLSLWFALRDVAKVVVERIDTVVVGLVVSVPAAAVYAVGQKVVSLAGRVVFPAADTFFPWSAELAASDDPSATRDAVVTATRLTFGLAGPICVVAATLAQPILDVWIGPGYHGAVAVVVLLVVAIALAATTHPLNLMLQGRGDARLPAGAYIAEAAVNLVASVALGKAIGIEGVALGSLVGTLVVQLGVFLPMAARRLGVPLRTLVSPLVVAHGPALVLSLAAWRLTAGVWTGVFELVVRAALIGGVYVVVLWRTGLRPDERARVRDVVSMRLRRRVDSGSSTALR